MHRIVDGDTLKNGAYGERHQQAIMFPLKDANEPIDEIRLSSTALVALFRHFAVVIGNDSFGYGHGGCQESRQFTLDACEIDIMVEKVWRKGEGQINSIKKKLEDYMNEL